MSAADRALLIQPPGLASAKELLRMATTPQQQAAVPLPAGAVMGSGLSDANGAPRPDGQAGIHWGSKSFLLVWADTAEPVRLTPSVLLAHLILCSRKVSTIDAAAQLSTCHKSNAATKMRQAVDWNVKHAAMQPACLRMLKCSSVLTEHIQHPELQVAAAQKC